MALLKLGIDLHAIDRQGLKLDQQHPHRLKILLFAISPNNFSTNQEYRYLLPLYIPEPCHHLEHSLNDLLELRLIMSLESYV